MRKIDYARLAEFITLTELLMRRTVGAGLVIGKSRPRGSYYVPSKYSHAGDFPWPFGAFLLKLPAIGGSLKLRSSGSARPNRRSVTSPQFVEVISPPLRHVDALGPIVIAIVGAPCCRAYQMREARFDYLAVEPFRRAEQGRRARSKAVAGMLTLLDSNGDQRILQTDLGQRTTARRRKHRRVGHARVGQR